MTTNVISMPEPLEKIGKRIDDAYEQTQHGRLQWIEGTLKLAFALAEGRNRFPSNKAFGSWLGENDHDHIGHQDRAALISMVSDDAIKTTRIVLTETQRTSWRHIWEEEIEPMLPIVGNTVRVSEPAIEPQETASPALPEETALPFSIGSNASPPSIPRRSPFYGWERAAEVQEIYQDPHTRTAIGKIVNARGGGDLWSMILTALDEGFLKQTNFTIGDCRRLSLRILFPDERAKLYCRNVDLWTGPARKRVRELILPTMIANKDAILAAPAQIGQILNRAQYEARQQPALARLVERRAALPKHEHEVVMYGETFWPNPNPAQVEYTYDQCRAACWYFHETNQLYEVTAGGGDSVVGRVRMMLFSVRWFAEYADREMTGDERDKIKMVFRLIHGMARAMENNPKGEIKRPPTPTSEGEW
jgi:hypothetical protein